MKKRDAKARKKVNILTLSLSFIFLCGIGCAGMDRQYQRNMAVNAVGYGVLGAATGAVIGAAADGDVGLGVAIGGLVGAGLGVANTPSPCEPPSPTPPRLYYAPPPVYYYPVPPVVFYTPGFYYFGGGYCHGRGHHSRYHH